MNRLLEISTAAGADVFVARRFTGRKELGRPYESHLELLSERSDVAPEKMLGTNATVQLEMTDGSSQRFFNGYVTRFVRAANFARVGSRISRSRDGMELVDRIRGLADLQ
jgi:uncharacterized protein involved in type VI secretion and phage assembly